MKLSLLIAKFLLGATLLQDSIISSPPLHATLPHPPPFFKKSLSRQLYLKHFISDICRLHTNILTSLPVLQGFPSGSAVKNPLATQEVQARPLVWKDALEKEMESHGQKAWWATVCGLSKSPFT